MEFEKLKKIIAEVLNVDEEEITLETTFVDDLGADSLDVFQIIMGLEEEFDIVNTVTQKEKEAINNLKDEEKVDEVRSLKEVKTMFATALQKWGEELEAKFVEENKGFPFSIFFI